VLAPNAAGNPDVRRAGLVAVWLLVSCNLHVEEPKQNEDWSIPPAQYGEAHFDGLQAPRQRHAAVADAGAE